VISFVVTWHLAVTSMITSKEETKIRDDSSRILLVWFRVVSLVLFFPMIGSLFPRLKPGEKETGGTNHEHRPLSVLGRHKPGQKQERYHMVDDVDQEVMADGNERISSVSQITSWKHL